MPQEEYIILAIIDDEERRQTGIGVVQFHGPG
jgi:hypothetical protein